MELVKTFVTAIMLLATATGHALEAPLELRGKTVTYLLGYGPGGPHDTVARPLVQAMNRLTDINFVLVNKPGASGVIAANDVINAPPNGQILLHSGTEIIINHLDQVPLAPSPSSVMPVINFFEFHPSPVVKKGSINNIADLIAASKSVSGISYGTSTTITTLLTASFLEAVGIRNALQVPYRTAQAMFTATLAGEVTLTITSNWQSFYDNQQIQVLALSGPKKPDYPNILTLKEAGVNIDINEYVSVFVHRDTPKHIAEFYNRLIALALTDPEVVRSVTNRNGSVIGGNLQRAKDNHQRYTALRENMHRKYQHLLKQ